MSDLLTPFLTSKQAAGCTHNTVLWYRMCIRNYLTWCDEVGEAYKKPDTIESYLVYLRQTNKASSTVSGYFTALAAWFTWLHKRKYIADNPLSEIQKPKQIRPVKKRLPRLDFIALYASIAVNKWIDQRDKCLLLVMFYSGLRATETVSLVPTDVDLDNCTIAVRRGKGEKPRLVPCHQLLTQELPLYFEMRPPFKSEFLFVADDGHGRVRGQLSTAGLRMTLTRRFANAGIKYHNPHAFRHSFAIEFLNNGMEMSAVSAVMGHSSVKTTESEYAYWLTSGLQREYNEAIRRIDASA